MTTEYTITLPSEQFSKLANLLQLICVAGLQFHGTGDAIPTVEDLKPIWNAIMRVRIAQAQNDGRASELDYLRYFAEKVVPCLGPADGAIIQSIREQFMKKTGKKLPKGYGITEDDDEA